VEVEHGSLWNYVLWRCSLSFEPGARSLMHTSPSFDLTVTSVWRRC